MDDQNFDDIDMMESPNIEPEHGAPAEQPQQRQTQHQAEPEQPQYQPSFDGGDAGLNASLMMFGNVGIHESDGAMVAAQYGDLSALEYRVSQMRGAKRAQAEAALNLMRDAYQRFSEADKYEAARIEAQMNADAGGDWKELRRWAMENADEQEAELMEQAMTEGPAARKLLAKYLSAMRDLHGDQPQQPQQPAARQRMTARSQPSEPMNDAQYSIKAIELSQKLGEGYYSHPEYQALVRAWKQSKR